MSRRDALIALEDEYPVTADTSGEEDFDWYINGDVPIDRYCIVTRSGDYYYLRTFEDIEAAKLHGEVNIDDSTYPETPVVLVDLDTGQEWGPKISVTWVPA